MEADRVRANTSIEDNRRIDENIRRSVETYSHLGRQPTVERIKKLEQEWDIERVLELNASSLALTGLLLGARFNRKWLLVPGIVLPFLLLHAIQGWCPPLPILRKLGVRTRQEIDFEKYALKALVSGRT